MVMDAVCGARLVSEIGLCVSRRVFGVIGGSQWPQGAGWVLVSMVNMMSCFLFRNELVFTFVLCTLFY